MSPPDAAAQTHLHDVFISYSRKDLAFARALERALGSYTPPKGIAAPHQRLRVFRDQSDLTGTEYHQSIARHLAQSRKLVLLCSPRARASAFVGDEVRQFVAVHGAEHVVPLIVDGLPNNEAGAEQEGLKAFPEALCEAMQMPLAGDYRQFNVRKDRLDRGAFHGAWYTLLANVLDVSRKDIEQRDQKRAARRRAITAAIVAAVIVLLSVALVLTLIARNEAVRQREQAEHRRLVALTRLVASRATEQAAQGHEMWARLLARQAYLFDERVGHEALAPVDAALRAVLGGPGARQVSAPKPFKASAVNAAGTLLATASDDGRITLWRLAGADGAPQMLQALQGHKIDVVSLAFSPDGKMLASGSWDETVRLWDLAAEQPASKVLLGHTAYVQSVAFSPDGQWLASGGDDATLRVWRVAEAAAAPVVFRAPDGALRSVAFGADGRRLVAGTSAGTALVWERAEPGAPAQVFRTNGDAVNAAVLSHNGRLLAAAAGRRVHLWDVANPATKPRTLVRDFEVTRIAFSPDSRMLALGQTYPPPNGAAIELWQLDRLDAPPVVLAAAAGVDALTYGLDYLIAVGRGKGSGTWHVDLQRWRVPTQALADEVCAKVTSNLPTLPWEQLIGADVPYERTCTRHEVHPDIFSRAENLAREGQLERALALLRRKDELDQPEAPPRNREAELKAFVAQGLNPSGLALARVGDIDGAVAVFRRILELDPTKPFDPVARAKAARAAQLALDAGQRGREGDYEAALALYTQARALDPSRDADPKALAAKEAAAGLLRRGAALAQRGDIKPAVAAVRKALGLDPALTLPAESWNELCWNGALWGQGTDVMFACDRAVEADTGSGSLDSRGVARVQAGDLDGALQDLRAVVEAAELDEALLAQRRAWIAALERGDNPFTAELLAGLRKR